MRPRFLCSALLGVLLVTGCDDGGGTDVIEPPVETGIPDMDGRWEGTVTWVSTSCQTRVPDPATIAVVIQHDGNTLRWRFDEAGSREWFGNVQEGGEFGVVHSTNDAGDRTSSTIRGTATSAALEAREDYFESITGVVCEEVRDFELEKTG